MTWNVAMQIRNQIDVVLVAALLGADSAGWLAAAYRVVFIPVFLPVVITTPLYPIMGRVAHDAHALVTVTQRGLKSVLLLTVPVAAMMMALAPIVPSVLHWGSNFERSVPLMLLLAIDQPLGAIDMVLYGALMAIRGQQRWLWVGVIAAAFNPVLNVLVLPWARTWMDNPAIAAAAIELGTELLMLAGAWVLLPRGTLGRSQLSLAGRLILASGALMAVVRGCLAVSPVLAVAAGCVVFVVAALALRVLTIADVVHMRQFTQEVLIRRLAGASVAQ